MSYPVFNNKIESIDVRFLWNIYQSPTTDYQVSNFEIINKEGKKERIVTCVGSPLPDLKGIIYSLEGYWTETNYGHQFQVTGFIQRFSNTRADVVGYLGSPVFKGIGKKTANSIYNAFGKDSFHVIEYEPNRLTTIKGISKKLAKQTSITFHKNREVVRILSLVKDCTSIGINGCSKIYEKYGEKSAEIIKTNPYRLTYIKGIDFPTADAIGKKFGLAEDSYERMKCAALYVLQLNELSGNLGMDLQDFGRQLMKTLHSKTATPVALNQFLSRALKDEKWKQIRFCHLHTDRINANYLYRRCTFEAEASIAANIIRLKEMGDTIVLSVSDNEIRKYEKQYEIKADKAQIDAINMALKSNFSIITGGPGTGKTTIIRIIAEIFKNKTGKEDLLFMAPTGRAARKIRDNTGFPASTIHSRLQLRDTESISFDNNSSEEDDETDITESLVVIDEVSMLDVWLAKVLFEKIHSGVKVILVGDADQLQSVGPGAVLRDLISCGCVPCSCLTHVFRQGDGCILTNAEKIREGNPFLETGNDFEIHNGLFDEALEDEMIKAYLHDRKVYGPDNVVCLCPVKDYAAGVNSMNVKIQQAVNPPSAEKPECKVGSRIFRKGDLAMELKNNLVTANGDIGVVTDACGVYGSESVTVLYFGTDEVKYEGEDLSHLTLAYAMTVHKAQGSEYDSVITCLQDKNYHMLKRNIPYTAITRAKKIVRFYGSRNALSRAIRTPETNTRKTLLSEILRIQEGKAVVFLDGKDKKAANG